MTIKIFLKNKERGSSFLFSLIFIVTSTYLLALIFKIYFSSITLIKSDLEEKKTYNEFLSINKIKDSSISVYPQNSEVFINFNNFFKNKNACPFQNISIKGKIFPSSRFCFITSLNEKIYKGNLISKNDISLNENLLVSSGDIYFPHTLTLKEETSYIISISSIDILKIKGKDLNKQYYVFLYSGNNKISISKNENIEIFDVLPNEIPTISQEIMNINF